jgi:hypothetical protein
LNLQHRVTLINTELNSQGCEHVKQLRSKAKFIQLSLRLRRLLNVLAMLIATVTNTTGNNGLRQDIQHKNKNDTKDNDLIPITVTFDLIHASLGRHFGSGSSSILGEL